jgi:hypothetical protein
VVSALAIELSAPPVAAKAPSVMDSAAPPSALTAPVAPVGSLNPNSLLAVALLPAPLLLLATST